MRLGENARSPVAARVHPMPDMPQGTDEGGTQPGNRLDRRGRACTKRCMTG